MAIIQTNFYSKILGFKTDINVIIPSPDAGEIQTKETSEYFHKGAKFQVLYLLHGTYGDYTDWVRLSGIERYAQEYKIAVIMPSAANSFYQDMKVGSDYYTYVAEELPDFVAKLFPISTRREDAFIAGLSMGGYGAVRIALKQPEKFAACGTLSGVLNVQQFRDGIQKYMTEDPYAWSCVFQDTAHINSEEVDLFQLLDRCIYEGKTIPRIYQTVGTEDTVAYEMNVYARERFQHYKISYTYEEKKGIHDWNFWDMQIKRFMQWVKPMGTSVEGV